MLLYECSKQFYLVQTFFKNTCIVESRAIVKQPEKTYPGLKLVPVSTPLPRIWIHSGNSVPLDCCIPWIFMLCIQLLAIRHMSANWPKKLNFTEWWNYYHMQATHMSAQYYTFLIKCTKVNKMKKITLVIDKICIFRPLTKIHDHFIADQHIHANFIHKW